ncbi:hypothetical protein M405DRAFT_142539 [Rhizopogon salebrosus TDB-379]|nr:hypothetical protein M405DRAFT_142539 [Rhizopogon salebrosus TDB-379]
MEEAKRGVSGKCTVLTSDAWTHHVWQPLIGIWDCKAEDRQFAGHQPAGHFFRGGKDSCTPRTEAGPNEKLMVPTCEICSLSVSVSRNGMLSLTQPQAKIGYARPAVSSPSAQNRSIFAVCDASQPFRCRLRTLRVSARFKLTAVWGRGLSTFSTLAVHVRRWRCPAFISLCGTVNFTRINPTSCEKLTVLWVAFAVSPKGLQICT